MVYVLFCLALTFSHLPTSSIEPVDLQQQQQQQLSLFRGRGPKEAAAHEEGTELSDMLSLLNSPMFAEQGIKLKWIKERMIRSA